MHYSVLARKWRPKSLQEMVGQENIVTLLTHALQQQRLHHAYLFCGTRGVGKTTLARILTKCLSCATGPTATPCNQCLPCQQIDQGSYPDFIEIDAASRTKVEDTRELLDNVLYAPVCGKYKIYLIDEVHMLSGHSFNALLKTLEEPPAHVKFLLATTDPHKLPLTVLSRCLKLSLRYLSVAQISHHLAQVLIQENIAFETAALTAIARAAQGSMRDALSLLDPALVFCEESVTLDKVSQLLGTENATVLLDMLEALIDKNSPKIFTLVHDSNMTKLCKTEEEAKLTVEKYEQDFKSGKTPYDTPYYYQLTTGTYTGYFIVKNKSSGKALKSINYIQVQLNLQDYYF